MYLIYKLNYITGICRKKRVYIGFCTICDFGPPLSILEPNSPDKRRGAVYWTTASLFLHQLRASYLLPGYGDYVYTCYKLWFYTKELEKGHTCWTIYYSMTIFNFVKKKKSQLSFKVVVPICMVTNNEWRFLFAPCQHLELSFF